MTEPSVAAVAKALETTQHDQADVSWPDTGWGRCTPWHLCGLCTAVALALDAVAREREAAVWEEAAKFVDANRCPDSFRMEISCGHVPCGYSKAVAEAFRSRAAETRGTG